MLSWLSVIGKFLSALFAWVPVVLGWLAGYRRAKQDAADEALENARKAAEIDESTDALPDDERRKWLYGKDAR